MNNASRRRRSRSSSRWVVEIGAAHIAAGQFEAINSKTELTQLAHRELPVSEASEEAETIVLESALRELMGTLSIRDEVMLVIPGQLVLTKLVRVPVGAEAHRPKLIEFEVRQVIPFDLAQVYWAHQEIGIHEGELEVLVVAAKSTGVDRLWHSAKAAGLAVSAVVAAGPTLLNPTKEEGTPSAVISIGARTTHLVFQNGPRTYLRTLTLAGNSVTHEISAQLERSLSEAEQLKVGVLRGKVRLPDDTPAGAAVKAATAGFIARLKLELNRTVMTQVTPAGMVLPHTLHLAGGGACLPGLVEALRSADLKEVRCWQVPNDMGVGDTAAGEIDRVGAERFADLIGAYQASVQDGQTMLDLAPPGLRQARAAKRQRPRWVVAAALLVIATFLPGVHYYRLAAARNTAANTLRQAVVPVQVLHDRAAEHGAELDRLRESAQIWEDRLQSKHAWEGLLADLQTSLATTGDVWLERLQVLPVEATGTAADAGAARLHLRVSGRLLDRENPLSRVSQHAYERVTSLLEQFLESTRITGIEGERFDASEPGMLRFDFTLVVNPRSGP